MRGEPRHLRWKPGRLVAYFDKRADDRVFHSPCRPDGHLLYGLFDGHVPMKEFLSELEKRGYDLTTLRLQVDRANNESKEEG